MGAEAKPQAIDGGSEFSLENEVNCQNFQPTLATNRGNISLLGCGKIPQFRRGRCRDFVCVCVVLCPDSDERDFA